MKPKCRHELQVVIDGEPPYRDPLPSFWLRCWYCDLKRGPWEEHTVPLTLQMRFSALTKRWRRP